MEAVHPIRAYRLSQKPPLSLVALAKRIGVAKGTLSRWETRMRVPDHALVPAISAQTGIPPAVLRPDLAGLFTTTARGRTQRAKSPVVA
jgi:transcriptional regulator with XRE-family HTH domain